jgi:microcystin-dependent protein
MTITGSNTTSFGFQKLGSNDDAGYSTINEVVDGIDTILNASDRLIKASQTPTVAYVITGDGVDWVRGLVVTASITDLNVTTGKLAELAVTTAKINDLAVTTGKINDLAVTTGKIIDSAVTSAKIADATIVNADISATAGIVDTKLATIATASKVSNSATTAASANTASAIVARDASGNFTAGTITATLTGNASTVTTNANLTGPITSVGNATTIATSTALPGNPTVGTATGSYPTGLGDRTIADVGYVNSAVSTVNTGGSITLAGDVGGLANANSIGASKVTSAMIVNDTIVNADINSAAAIAYSKLALGTSIVNADISVSAAIAYSKLNLASSITSADIVNNTIVLGDLATALQAFLIPTGTVSAYAGSTAPTGYLLCDGSAVSQTTYAALYTVIGANAYGTDSAGNFSLPNLKGRAVIGVGVGTEITGVRGTLQGVKEVTLTAAESGVPAHTHPINASATTDGAGAHTHSIAHTDQGYATPNSGNGTTFIMGNLNGYNNFGAGVNLTAQSAGGHNHTIPANTAQANTTAAAASAHTNIQPSLPLNYIIKV